MTEGRVIHIGIADDIDEVALFPAPVQHFLFIDGQKRHNLPPKEHILYIIADLQPFEKCKVGRLALKPP